MIKFMPWLLYSWQRTLVPIEKEAGWAHRPGLDVLAKRKSLAPAGIQTPDQAVQA